MAKISTLKKLSFRLLLLAGLAFGLGWRPEFSGVSRAVSSAVSRAPSSESAKSSSSFSGWDDSVVPESARVTESCEPISESERTRLRRESGVDLVSFVESSTKELHSARSPEDQLKVVATRFDHANWSRAWLSAADEAAVSDDPRVLRALRLQTNLSHASLFLSRYHRVMENGFNQEDSALRAFHWKEDAKNEINGARMKTLVRGYLPHTCVGADQAQYGCARGETLYRVRTIISPRVACRFADKREQYAAVFWVRISSEGARIVEVEANGQRLVKMTYDDLAHKKLLSVLSPNVSETLIGAGLDPFRVPMMWRRWIGQSETGERTPASN